MSATLSLRSVQRTIIAHRQREGGGFIVRRPLPSAGVIALDPFLLIDEMGPAVYGPGEAIGAPDHPHRGFETVTYMLDGEFEHEDSAGHKGVLTPGSVQWMTAGAGIVHSEMPSAKIREQGGRIHGFQIWLNLPSKLKMTRPRYQELAPESIPVATSEDGLASVRVVAGQALGIDAAIDTHTPIQFHDWTLKPGAKVQTVVPSNQNLVVYVFGGRAEIAGQLVEDGHLAVMSDGELLELTVPADAAESARMLVLAGQPHNEPVARYGPFVMNTEREVYEAIRDYQAGRFGEITRTAQVN